MSGSKSVGGAIGNSGNLTITNTILDNNGFNTYLQNGNPGNAIYNYDTGNCIITNSTIKIIS